MMSIKEKFSFTNPNVILTQSLEMFETIKTTKEKKFHYIYNKFGDMDGMAFHNCDRPFTVLLPYLNSGNKLLDDLFLKYPKFSEKQWFYWHKIIDEIYFLNETEDGKKQMLDTKDSFYWLEMLATKCKLNLYDRDFVPKFWSTIQEQSYLNRPLSLKQLALVEKYKKRYWKQLSSITIDKI